MLAVAQRDELTARFRARIDRLTLQTGTAVVVAWDALEDYGDRRVREYARRVQPVTVAAKTAAVALGVAYYTVIAQQRPVPVNATDIPTVFDARAGFVAYWNALGNERPWPEAVQAGRNRAGSTASGLVVSSSRLTGDRVLPEASWTRVASGNACDFCQEAAGGTYQSAESADFGHERCSCSVQPV